MNIYFDAITDAVEKGLSAEGLECPVCKGKTLSIKITGEKNNGGQYPFKMECTNGCSYYEIYKQGKIEEAITGDLVLEEAERQKLEDLQKEYEEICKRNGECTTADLESMDIPPTEFIVEGLIPVGLTLLCAPPKYGKSWMSLQLANAVASGHDFLGYKTNKARVRYFALEDSFRVLKERNAKQNNAGVDNLHIRIKAGNLQDGNAGSFMREIMMEKMLYPDLKLIIIDTFQKIRGTERKSENQYAHETREGGYLHEFALENNLAIVLVHHVRKMVDPSDPFNNIGGSNGIIGATDTNIVLTREARNSENTVLNITGRHIEDQEIVIAFNKATCHWEKKGSAEEIRAFKEREAYLNHPLRKGIVAYLTHNAELKGYVSNIKEECQRLGYTVKETAQKANEWIEKNKYRLEEEGICIDTHTSSGHSSNSYTIKKIEDCVPFEEESE